MKTVASIFEDTLNQANVPLGMPQTAVEAVKKLRAPILEAVEFLCQAYRSNFVATINRINTKWAPMVSIIINDEPSQWTLSVGIVQTSGLYFPITIATISFDVQFCIGSVCSKIDDAAWLANLFKEPCKSMQMGQKWILFFFVEPTEEDFF